MTDEARIALFLDYENLTIGSRDNIGIPYQHGPVADALAERGRVMVRRAYADWSFFGDERKDLARNQIELIEMPQGLGGGRKNAADIKMSVDVVEMALTRPWIDTYAIGTGDSDFSPLVHKLRELDRTVIGFGVRQSTSKLLPPACDEWLMIDDLVEAGDTRDLVDPVQLLVSTLAGLERRGATPIRASELKRAIKRKDSTFDEAAHGYRAFGEMIRAVAANGVVSLTDDGSRGNPLVELGNTESGDEAAFALLAEVVAGAGGEAKLSGLKQAMRQKNGEFSERRLGHRTFLAFVRAAENQGLVDITQAEGSNDHIVTTP